jgi:hypothetical protein
MIGQGLVSITVCSVLCSGVCIMPPMEMHYWVSFYEHCFMLVFAAAKLMR